MDKSVRPDDIEALIADFDASGFAELHIQFDGFELHLSADPNAATAARQPISTSAPGVRTASEPVASSHQSSPAASPSGGPSGADDLQGFEIVRAPYLGIFYRAPKPGEAPYVEIGSEVSSESDVCLVEVMKLFTAVRAGVTGSIARILATDGQQVEAGQPLFAIESRG